MEYNKQALYDVKERYEAQLRDPEIHKSEEVVVCIENALESLERRIEGKPIIPYRMRELR